MERSNDRGPRRKPRTGRSRPRSADAGPRPRGSGTGRAERNEERPRRKTYSRSDERPERPRRSGPRSDGERPSFRKGPPRGRGERPFEGSRRPYDRSREERPEPRLRESRLKNTDKWNDAPPRKDRSSRTGDRVRQRFDGDPGPADRPRRSPQRGEERPRRRFEDGGRGSDERPRRFGRNERPAREDRRPARRTDGEGSFDRARRNDDRPRRSGPPDRTYRGRWSEQGPAPYRKRGKAPAKKQTDAPEEGLVRLNRYLAHSGMGSRRDADQLIAAGVVQVNGKTVTELGTKVKPGKDVVHVEGQKMSMEVKRYVLLNKPKDTITTTEDPEDRKTVMGLVSEACDEQIFPVGRLDRNTTGLLLLTNDGELANRLTHPRYGIDKLYHVTLDKNVSVDDLHRLTEGVQLDDGPAHADEASHVGESRKEVGVKLHTGRNRVVRRMFEALGYTVVKLDRVMLAGLTKKDLPRGEWRHLTDAEVSLLKRIK